MVGAAVAVIICCSIPVLLATGVLGVLLGWLGRAWPVLLVGAAALIYALARLLRAKRGPGG